MKCAPMTGIVAFAFMTWANGGLLAADTKVPVAPPPPMILGLPTNQPLAHGWYGPGSDGGAGYFNPARSGAYNPYPYYNLVGGESYAALYEADLPDQNESPLNPPAALTRHVVAAPQAGGHIGGPGPRNNLGQGVLPSAAESKACSSGNKRPLVRAISSQGRASSAFPVAASSTP